MNVDRSRSYFTGTDSDHIQQGIALKMSYPWRTLEEPQNSSSAPIIDANFCKRILFEEIYDTRYKNFNIRYI